MDTAVVHSLVACHDCDLLCRLRPLCKGQRAICSRCGAVLVRKNGDTLDLALMLSLAALILFVLANVFPFMTFKLEGRVQESLLFTGVQELYDQGFLVLAVLVFGASILFPLMKILGTIYVLLPLRFNRCLWNSPLVFRFVEALSPWAMMEVYMLGVFVAYVKLTDLATIVLGTALFSFSALIVLLAAAGAALEPDEIWDKLEAIS